MAKITKEIIKEFQKKYCDNCKSYIICGAELAGCPDWEKFIKDKK
jgi:hypothetical protein